MWKEHIPYSKIPSCAVIFKKRSARQNARSDCQKQSLCVAVRLNNPFVFLPFVYHAVWFEKIETLEKILTITVTMAAIKIELAHDCFTF